jgi:hypothetical protein
MEGTLAKDIAEYYKLKQKYEDRINRQKRRIINNPSLSGKEKRQKWKQLKTTCINCKKPGGTVFTNKNHVLTAVCGSTTACDLDIKIDRGNYSNIRSMNQAISDEIDSVRTDIVATKLNLLFNYTDEATALKRFETLRKQLATFSEALIRVRKRYLGIVNDSDNKAALARSEVELFIQQQKLKALGEKFRKDPRPGFVQEMVEAYIATIQPLADEIRKLKYKYSAIETNQETGIMNLVQDPYTLEQLIVPDGNKTTTSVGESQER